MTEPVILPFWLVVAGGMTIILVLVLHGVLPAFRWFLRQRAERVMESIGSRLQLAIPPFALAGRRALADRLVLDDEVQAAIDAAAAESGRPRREVERRVTGYAREIVPGFNAWVYFRMGYTTARAFLRMFYRVRLTLADRSALDGVSSDNSVVIVMNHRSNVDYLLVTYLASDNTMLSYAIGEWARVWPFRQLMRAAGGYFVRRGSGDPLYRQVLKRYVQMATEAKVPQAAFIEGRLSRDGMLQEPRLGLLSWMVEGWDPAGDRDVVFMPVGVNYDRVPEERKLIADPDGAHMPKGAIFMLRSTMGVFADIMLKVLSWRMRDYGHACAAFGTPVSLRAFVARSGVDFAGLDRESRYPVVAGLAEEIMAQVAVVVPALPMSVLAWLLVEAGSSPVDEVELTSRARLIVDRLKAAGTHVFIPREGFGHGFREALAMLVRRKIVISRGYGLFEAREQETPLLRYYAGPIVRALADGDDATA